MEAVPSMKHRAPAKARIISRAGQPPASTEAGEPPATVRSRFAIRLPLHLHPEQEHIPPSSEQDSPASRLFYTFLDILSGISHEVPEMAKSGFLAFDVEAAYPGLPPGVIPDDEVGPVSIVLQKKLAAVIQRDNPKLRTIIETSPNKQGLLKVAAQFWRIVTVTTSKEIIIWDYVDEASRREISDRMADELRRRGYIEESPSPLQGDIVEEITDDINKALKYDAPHDKEHGQGGPAALADDKYAALTRQLEQRNHAFRQQLAAELALALKEEMRRRPHDSYDEKVELVRWVNAELDRFSMAFKHDKTGEAASFKAKSFETSHPEIGHFQLSSKDALGREKTTNTPNLDTLLSKLDLMDAPARREALAEWQAKVGRERRGANLGS
jgi:hypothetical protein